MKKFMIAVFTALSVVIVAVAFAACGDGETDIVGTYKTHSVVRVQGEESLTINVGELYDGGVLEEDTYTMMIRGDNSWTLITKSGNSEYVSDGTWTEEDGLYSLYMPSETGSITATLDGKLLSIVTYSEEVDGATFSITVILEKVSDDTGDDSDETTAEFAGTYKFRSMSMTQNGETVTVNVGDSLGDVTLTEEYYVLVVRADNTFSMSRNTDGGTDYVSGTWSGSGNEYVLRANESDVNASLNGTQLILGDAWMTVVFEKTA